MEWRLSLVERTQDKQELISALAWLGHVCGWVMVSSSVVWFIEGMWIIMGFANGDLARLPMIIQVTQLLAGLLICALAILGVGLIQLSRKVGK